MSETSSADALLTVAVQDLAGAARLAAERLPGVVAHASDPDLAALLKDAVAAVARHLQELEESGRGTGGDPNLWMAGILDDAERDVTSVAKGPLLDTAMIGAVRKAAAATIVSYDTAVMLAQAVGDGALTQTLSALRMDKAGLDHALANMLERITIQL